MVEAAWRLTGQQKAEALARILADGIKDDARLDVEPLFLAAIRDLESAHVQTLRTMTNGTNPKDVIEGPPVREGTEWATEHLVEALPHLASGMDYVVATLDRVGYIVPGFARFEVAPWWRVTRFGHQCLVYLQDRRVEDTQSFDR